MIIIEQCQMNKQRFQYQNKSKSVYTKNKSTLMDTQRIRLTSQLHQAQQKICQLQAITTQLTQTIQSTELPTYQQLLTRLAQHQQTSSQTITTLNLRISQLETQLYFHQHRSGLRVSDLEQKLQTADRLVDELKKTLNQLMRENTKLKKEINAHKEMIKNQQHLIDDYRRSIQEEKQIQREIVRCEVKEIENKLKKQMNLKLIDIKHKHKKQLAKANQSNIAHSYQTQIKQLKKFITDKKTQLYSTTTQQTNLQTLDYAQSHLIDKKKPFTEHKPQMNLKNPQNLQNHHILIFDEGQPQSLRHHEKQNSKHSLNHQSKQKDTNVFQAIKSLGSTLESGIYNFKSIQKKQDKYLDNCHNSFHNFESIGLDK